MSVLVACKNEEDPFKNEGARVVTTLFINFSDAQGQLTPKSVMESCRNSKPSTFWWLNLLPARMKKIHWKMKVLEWSQRFPHYKSMGILPNAQGQLPHKSFVGCCPISNQFKILWCLRDIHVWKCGRTHARTDGRTDGRTPVRVPYYKLTLSLRLWWANNMYCIYIARLLNQFVDFRFTA